VEDPSSFGLVETAKNGRVTGFIEKPEPEEIRGKETNINAGVYLLEPEILKLMRFNKVYSIEKDVFPLLAGKEFFGMIFKNIYWMDCGTFEKYRQVTVDILRRKFVPYIKIGMKKNVSVGAGSVLETGTKMTGPLVIGNYCLVGENAKLTNCIIWDKVRIEEGAELNNCIIAHRCRIGKSSILTGAVLGADTFIKAGSRINS